MIIITIYGGLLMILTKEMKKDFMFLCSYTKRYKKMPFDNRIF